MALGRRRLLGVVLAAAGAGCIESPGRDCPGATYRLRLSPADGVENPLSLDAGSLSTAGNAVVEAAIEDEHVESCVTWEGSPGPSEGLREVGERIEARAGVSLADRTADVRLDAVRGGSSYRLVLEVEG
jgi:hypothetical protein